MDVPFMMRITLHSGECLKMLLFESPGRYAGHACTPSPVGFTALNALYQGPLNRGVWDACDLANGSRQVVVLPEGTGPHASRLLLVPKVWVLGEAGRRESYRLAMDLFDANAAARIPSLEIHHFAGTRRYYKDHLQGVLEAIRDRTTEGFGGLERLCVPVAEPHLDAFWCQMKEVLEPARMPAVRGVESIGWGYVDPGDAD